MNGVPGLDERGYEAFRQPLHTPNSGELLSMGDAVDSLQLRWSGHKKFSIAGDSSFLFRPLRVNVGSGQPNERVGVEPPRAGPAPSHRGQIAKYKTNTDPSSPRRRELMMEEWREQVFVPAILSGNDPVSTHFVVDGVPSAISNHETKPRGPSPRRSGREVAEVDRIPPPLAPTFRLYSEPSRRPHEQHYHVGFASIGVRELQLGRESDTMRSRREYATPFALGDGPSTRGDDDQAAHPPPPPSQDVGGFMGNWGMKDDPSADATAKQVTLDIPHDADLERIDTFNPLLSEETRKKREKKRAARVAKVAQQKEVEAEAVGKLASQLPSFHVPASPKIQRRAAREAEAEAARAPSPSKEKPKSKGFGLSLSPSKSSKETKDSEKEAKRSASKDRSSSKDKRSSSKDKGKSSKDKDGKRSKSKDRSRSSSADKKKGKSSKKDGGDGCTIM